MLGTVEPKFNDLRFNDILGITINIRSHSKSYSKMYGAEPRYNDLQLNDIPGIMISRFNDIILTSPWHIVKLGPTVISY